MDMSGSCTTYIVRPHTTCCPACVFSAVWCLWQADSPWLYVVPWGLRKLLVWIHQRYNAPEIYILENGVDCPNESALSPAGKQGKLVTLGKSVHQMELNMSCKLIAPQGAVNKRLHSPNQVSKASYFGSFCPPDEAKDVLKMC